MGLAPLPDEGVFVQMLRKHTLVLYGWSPAVLPKPSDWPARHLVVGYFHEENDQVASAWYVSHVVPMGCSPAARRAQGCMIYPRDARKSVVLFALWAIEVTAVRRAYWARTRVQYARSPLFSSLLSHSWRGCDALRAPTGSPHRS